MEEYTNVPSPILDQGELEIFEDLIRAYQDFLKIGRVTRTLTRLEVKIYGAIPRKIKGYIRKLTLRISEAKFAKETMALVAKGFKALDTHASKLTVNKAKVVKRIKAKNPTISTYNCICFARGYQIEGALKFKEMEDIVYSALQGGFTGFFGWLGIPLNMILSTFLYFRAAQDIALHYGYDVKTDIYELQIASAVAIKAIDPNQLAVAGSLSAVIGNLILTPREGAQEGNPELYRQIRALAREEVMEAHQRCATEGYEKTVYEEMLDEIGKEFAEDASRKMIPVIGGVVGFFMDSAKMVRVIRLAKIFYLKRFLLEKALRIRSNGEADIEADPEADPEVEVETA